MPLASPPVVPPTAHDESVDLHCDHCGQDGHVNAFCNRKKKAQQAQVRRSSQGTGGTNSGGSESSTASLEIGDSHVVSSPCVFYVGRSCWFCDSVLLFTFEKNHRNL
jgi:hypothetical protein